MRQNLHITTTGVVWGGDGALKVMGNATIRQSAYDSLFDFNRNYVSIFRRVPDIAGYLSKVAGRKSPTLTHPTCISCPVKVTLVEFHGDLWHQKTRVPGLSCCVICVILRLAVLVELRLVTDRRTDTGHSIER